MRTFSRNVEDEPVFAGKIEWGDETVDVDILLTKVPYALIGTAMLRGTEMNLNFSSGKVLIKTVTATPGESQ